jgi:hypothetical protein
MTIARKSLAESSDPTAAARPGVASWYTPGLSDGLGDRLLMFDNSAAVPLELLRFPRPFSQSAAFELALRRRIDELTTFNHPAAATIRSIQWLGTGDGLALVSNQVTGRRLSEAFGQARGPAYAMELLRQLTEFVAALEQQGKGIAHGAINADRVVITETGRLVVVEHVLGSALATLCWPPSRFRVSLGVPMPGADRSVFDGRTDVFQLAYLALAVTLGRRINPTDDPRQAETLVAEACRPGLTRGPISPRLRHWLERALRLDGSSFATAAEAHEAFRNPTDEQPELKPAPPVALPRNPASERPIETAVPRARPGVARTVARVTWLRPKGSTKPAAASSAPPAREPKTSPVSARGVAFTFRGLGDVLPRPTARWIVPSLVFVVALQTAVIAVVSARSSARSATGLTAPSLLVDSPQPGATVMVDGKPAGVTPLRLSLGAGTKSIRLEPAGTAARVTGAGAAGAAAPAATMVDVTSDPAGARVTIDGKASGVTPLSVAVEPGAHEVGVSNGSASMSRALTVGAGTTAAVMASLAAPGSGAGWVTIASPVELQILEGGVVIGTTNAARLMLPVGRHDLVVSNAAIGFQAPVRVDVQPGKSGIATVRLPTGSVSINALPWATVSLDGRDLGTTPIANVDVPIGTHEFVLRHPQLGERRQSVLVTTKGPVRLVVDLNKR